MVKETRIVFGLEDISRIRVQCGKCDNEVALKPNGQELPPSLPMSCPHCGTFWSHSGARRVLAQDFVNELHRELRASSPVKLLLELDDD